jgi:ATP-dependent RNA helicase DeaD
MKFSELTIDAKILKALHEMGFEDMTDIQEKTIPAGLAGKDLIGQAMTGSGKTAAFGIPLIQRVKPRGGVQALVLTPTRELCNQVAAEIVKFAKHYGVQVAAVYGGVSIEPQIQKVRHSEIVVGTPGRIMDHMERGTLSLKNIHMFVLDEADRMLDMGFIDDIRRIMRELPSKRQTMLFSATMPEDIVYIAKHYMNDPLRIKTQAHVAKHLLKHIYYDVKREEKPSLLLHLLNKEKPTLALVFTGTRGAADFVNRYLQSQGIESRSIHGGHSQSAREDILQGFHKGRPHILIATDVAARGIDVKNISHVFNYDVPKNAEDYTHRTGRTARFGEKGVAITLLSKEDHPAFRSIIRYIEIEKGRLDDFKAKPVHMSEYSERRGGGGRGGSHGGRGGGYGRGPPRRRW